MTIIRKNYDHETSTYVANEIPGTQGRTLTVNHKTYQVMSDVWEDGYEATYLNGNGEVETVQWVEYASKVDATPEVKELAKKFIYNRSYKRHYDLRLREYAEEACKLERGVEVMVVRGRKVKVGTTGILIGFTQNQWGTKVGIALNGEKVVVEKNGRTFENYKNTVWTAISNVERKTPKSIDMNKVEQYADYKAGIDANDAFR